MTMDSDDTRNEQRCNGQIGAGPRVQAVCLQFEIPVREAGIRIQVLASLRPGLPRLRRAHDTVCQRRAVFANNV